MLCVRKNLKCSSCIVPYFYQKFRKYRARNVLFGRFVSPIPTFLCLRPGSPFLFPPSLSFSFFSSSCPFARKPRLRDLHLLYQFRFPLFKVPRSRPTHSLPFISVSCDHRSIANMEATVSLLYINFDSIRPNSIRSTIDSGIVYGDRRNGTCCWHFCENFICFGQRDLQHSGIVRRKSIQVRCKSLIIRIESWF